MNYLKKSFSVGALLTEKYRSEWERIFAPSTHRCEVCDGEFAPSAPRSTKRCFTCEDKPALVRPLGTCDHCKARDVNLYIRDRLFLCAKCAGLPPKVPAFWTCPDCGGTSSWGTEQLHRCAR